MEKLSILAEVEAPSEAKAHISEVIAFYFKKYLHQFSQEISNTKDPMKMI